MARTLSTMIPLGIKAPVFVLQNVINNQSFHLKDNSDVLATVIMFICNHCPFVKHINHGITLLANDYIPQGIQFLAINSNDVQAYPDDSPENMQLVAQTENYPFPYLFDETQEVAKAYNAVCTPDFFVFDNNLLLVYRGQLDDARPGNDVPVTGNSIRQALDNILGNQPVCPDQKPSIGCNIKWKT